MRRLEGTVQHYAWGSEDSLPRLLGREPDGQPWAELWLGAHPSAPSSVDGTSLADVVTADPPSVGERSVADFGPVLPYLLKVLTAARPLSLQAHPSRAQAEAGFAREEAAGLPLDASDRSYKDPWPKPELIVALGEFDALCGFADPAGTAERFARLGVPALDALVAPLTAVGGAAGLREVFVACCELPPGRRDLVGEVVSAAAAEADRSAWCRTAVELGAAFPDDPGVLAALLMNRVRLAEHEALYLDAGVLHGYLRGDGIEVMASSDNVLRGGLTAKHVDVPELVSVLDFTPTTPSLVPVVEEPAGVFRYETPAPEFALWRLEVDDGPVALPAADRGRIALVVSGSVRLGELDLGRGQSAWVEAGEDITAAGAGRVFLAAPGV